MKNFTKVLCLLIFFSAYLQAQSLNWTQTNGPEGGPIVSLASIEGALWAGTASGLYQSTDNGESWQRNTLLGFDEKVFSISRKTNEILMVVGQKDFTKSTLNFFLYQSLDTGATWEAKAIPDYLLYDGDAIEVFRANDGNLYLTTHSGTMEIYQSNDDGDNWTQINTPDVQGKLYHDGQSFIFTKTGASYISSDYGTTWTLWADRYFSDIIIEDSLVVANGNDFVVSYDLGENFDTIDLVNPASIFKIILGESSKLYAVTPFKIYVSSDQGQSWSDFGPSSYYQALPVYCYVENNNRFFYGTTEGTNDISQGINEITSTGHFRRDNGLVASSRVKVFSAGSRLFAIQSSEDEELYTSVDSGATWETIMIPYQAGNRGVHDVNHIGDVVFIATAQNIFKWENNQLTSVASDVDHYYNLFVKGNDLYAAYGYGVIHSNDLGVSWDTLNTPGTPNFSAKDFVVVGDSYLFSDQSALYLSDDQGSTWTEVDDNFSGSINYIEGVSKIFSHFADRYSQDNGLTWHDYEPVGLPSGKKAVSIVGNKDALFCLIEGEGVYVSFDDGTSWSLMENNGLETKQYSTLTLAENKLYLGSKTSGVWGADVGQVLAIPGSENPVLPVVIYPNPAKNHIALQFPKEMEGKINIIVVDVLGRQVLSKEMTSPNGVLELPLPKMISGLYFLKCHTEKQDFVGRVMVEN